MLAFLLKKKVVLAIIGGVLAVGVGVPSLSHAVPLLFPGARAKRGTVSDVNEIKEIGQLAVSRLQFSKVLTGQRPKNCPLEKSEAFVRRIMRGHVTTWLDFSRIDPTNGAGGTKAFSMPPLVSEAVIDEWMYYDSSGTGGSKGYNPTNFTERMDADFRKAMLKEASDQGRIDRAQRQAERVVLQLFPDQEEEAISFLWPEPAWTMRTP